MPDVAPVPTTCPCTFTTTVIGNSVTGTHGAHLNEPRATIVFDRSATPAVGVQIFHSVEPSPSHSTFETFIEETQSLKWPWHGPGTAPRSQWRPCST